MFVYLRFELGPDADREAFEGDLFAMRRLAETQTGFSWCQIGGDTSNERIYLVVSEWDTVDQVRAFEHHPEHEAVMARWEDEYAEEFQHRRFVPWVRPAPAEDPAT